MILKSTRLSGKVVPKVHLYNKTSLHLALFRGFHYYQLTLVSKRHFKQVVMSFQ